MKKRAGKKSAAGAPPQDGTSDADLFTREMVDVVRLGPDPRGRVRAAPRMSTPLTAPATDRVEAPDEDFTAPGVDRREIRKLKRGEHAVGNRLDLHGMTAAEACTSVGRFIEKSRHNRHRCVCIVHGRGLHSEGKAAILKPRVRECLRASSSVLAYASAPRSHGGAGAVYVLLRR